MQVFVFHPGTRFFMPVTEMCLVSANDEDVELAEKDETLELLLEDIVNGEQGGHCIRIPVPDEIRI